MTIAWEKGVRDPDRLIALQQSGLMGTGPEDAFDRLIELATELTGAPRGCITLVSDFSFNYKSAIGIPDEAPHSGGVADTFCRYVVGTGQPLIVDDAVSDTRTADNRAIQLHGVAAWAGYPIEDANGAVLGTFCLVDTSPHSWTDQDILVLATLAQAVSTEIALRQLRNELVEARARIKVHLDNA
ncbi:MAG: GAF domain-containing protein [Acidimicrobiales bacterium]